MNFIAKSYIIFLSKRPSSSNIWTLEAVRSEAMKKIHIPSEGQTCAMLADTDFDDYKIPAPGGGREKGSGELLLLFNDSEEAIKYALHLGDVIERMSAKEGYEYSIEKMKLIISCVNNQADFNSLNFSE